MAIVEDDVRNDSEEENEIEVVVEEGDQDSDDSDDEDDEMLERKVDELERRINDDQWQGHYDDHIELIQALWSLSELDRWRAAFERLHHLMSMRPEHWLMRISTEITLAHTQESKELIENLFYMATADSFSMTLISEWLSWALSGDTEHARTQLDELLHRYGPDPLGGKLLWDAKLELERTQLQSMSADAPEYAAQVERLTWCVEEASARPVLRLGPDPFQPLKEAALLLGDNDYVERLQKKFEVAKEYLEQITPFEDKLVLVDDLEEKLNIYQDYINKVRELHGVEKFIECDSYAVLKVLYDRATSECLPQANSYNLMLDWIKLVSGVSARETCERVLQACRRRCPHRHTFWVAAMERAEFDGEPERVKGLFEAAMSKGMESFKDSEWLWMRYLEFMRRYTDFDSEEHTNKLRLTFRLAWDSLADTWGEEANDCEVPFYWARVEYRRIKDYKRGREIFEEIFSYGDNKTMSKYWETLLWLELSRHPPLAENKFRSLFRRALHHVTDYPPAVARLWNDYERDFGDRATLQECKDMCDDKIFEWRETYQKIKEKMANDKQKGKQQNKAQNKKAKFDNKKKKKNEEQLQKGKRKSDQKNEGSEVKKKKDENTEVVERDTSGDSGGGVKRSHDSEEEGSSQSTEPKRQRTDSEESESRSAGRESCTLFVSNLIFKVDEQKLRDELSKYGEIVSMRVKSGVKAFGGSICYCQYKTPESVEEAVKHDRTPLDGRPMFLSRYSAKKTKQNFKYATTAEKNKLFVKNLPYSQCTKDALTKIFNKSGKLKDVRIVTFKDGKPKGLAYIEYEDEAAAEQARKETNGIRVGDRDIEVLSSAPPPRKDPGPSQPGTSLGYPKREPTGGMRRTQVSFIPSVLLKPSTSKAPAKNDPAAGSQAGSHDKRPLSNADFRSMLLK